MTTTPKPPSHLSPASRAFWTETASTYDLEPHDLRTLTVALEAHDRMTQARELLAVDGIVTVDRYGNPRAHPAVAIERDSRIAFLRAMRELGLDDEPTPLPPRRLR
jgi:P27 family predicted phage terminase small subunit